MQRDKETIKKVFSKFQKAYSHWPAVMGDGSGNVSVSGKPGWVYVRMLDGQSAQAYNGGKIKEIEDQEISVGYSYLNPFLLQVLDVRHTYAEALPYSNSGPHAASHMHLFPNGGDDVVWIDARQWMPLRVGPAGGLSVRVYKTTVWKSTGWEEIDDIIDLTSHVPGTGARYVLIAFDTSGNPQVTDGSTVDQLADLTAADIPALPSGQSASAAVGLYAGQTEIVETPDEQSFKDLRFSGAPMASQLYTGFTAGSIAFAGTGGVLSQDNTNLFWDDTNNRLGVGPVAGAPAARVHVVATTEQLRMGYDSNNYISLTVSSAGLTTFNAVGASSSFQFSDRIGILVAPATDTSLLITETSTATSGITNSGIQVNYLANPAASSSARYHAFRGTANYSSSSNLTDANALRGFFTGVVMDAAGTGTVTGAQGLQAVINSNSSGGTLTTGVVVDTLVFLSSGSTLNMTNLHMLKASAKLGPGTLNLTNLSGVTIESMSAGTNNVHLLIGTSTIPSGNWGIYNSSTNNNYFNGNISIGGTTFAASLAKGFQLVGSTAPSGNIADAAILYENDIAALRGTLHIREENGGIWKFDTGAATAFVTGCVFTQTATVTVSNTTTETTLVGSGSGSVTLPAGFHLAGKTVRIRASGIYSTQAVPITLNIRVKYGSVTVLETGDETPSGSVSSKGWSLDVEITCRTTGATGTVFTQSYGGFMHYSNARTLQGWDFSSTATTTIDTTASQAISITADWGGGVAAADSISCTNLSVEILN
jgi:hypothetical protein